MPNPQKGSTVKIKSTFKDESGALQNMSSASTTKNCVIEKPDGTLLTKAGSFTTNGSDSLIETTLSESENNQAGHWEYQWYIAMTGFTGRSSKLSFFVEGNVGE